MKFDFGLKNPDKAINLLVIALLMYNPMSYCINQFVNRFVQYGAWWDSAICLFVLLLFIINAVIPIISRINVFTVVSFVVCALLFAITLLGLVGKKTAEENFFFFFVTVFPYIFVGNAIRDIDSLMNDLEKVSNIIIISMCIWIALTYTSSGAQSEWKNEMAVAYHFLPFAMISANRVFKEKNFFSILWTFIAFAVLVIMGTRGPILFLILFIAINILRNSKSSKSILIVLLLGSVATIVLINFREILMWLNAIFENYGIRNAAVIKMLDSENLFDLSNGRDALNSSIYEYINKKPLLGYGIYADRTLINAYTHFLPTELFVDFGYVLGTVILVAIVVLLIKALNSCKKSDDSFSFILMLVFLGLVKLFFTGSYLQEPYFWMFLGASSCLGSNRIQHKK